MKEKKSNIKNRMSLKEETTVIKDDVSTNVSKKEEKICNTMQKEAVSAETETTKKESSVVKNENTVLKKDGASDKKESDATEKNSSSEIEFPTADLIRSELKRERNKLRYKKILKSTVYALIIVAAVAALIATLVLPVLQISGTSMEPTLNNGEIVVLVKTSNFERGELCAFSYSNKVLIKRVIGLPGDVIVIDQEGTVYVNGYALNEDAYITEKGLGECDVEFPLTVPENEYFLMGDKRETSIDSRSTVIGCIPKDQIIGKIFFKVWPFSEFSFIE